MRRKKQFTLKWFKEFGWLNNPFRLEIFNPVERYIAGLEKERQKINYFIIENYPFGTIKGDKGQGKTMLLLWLKQSLKDYKGTIFSDYYKAEKRGVSLSEQVIDSLTGISDKLVMGSLFKLKLKKLFKRKKTEDQKKSIYEILYRRNFTNFDDLVPFFEKKLRKQRFVLLIDDAHLLSEQDIEFLRKLNASPIATQIVASIDSGAQVTIHEKDDLKIKLSELSFNEMKDFLKNRIESVGGTGTEPFNDHILHSLYSKGKKNSLLILKIAYDQAVKIALREIADKKKGIMPKRIKQKQEPEEEFDEVAEYNKLMAEERRKHDPNAWIMQAKIEKEKELVTKEKQKVEQPPKQEKNDYSIQVIEQQNTKPIEIMGNDDSDYEIKEVRRRKKPLKNIPKVRKKTRRKKSSKKRAHHNKKKKHKRRKKR